MSQIKLDYDDFYDNWLDIIKNELKLHDVIFTPDIPINICNSVKSCVNIFLKTLGFTVKNTIFYRVSFMTKLHNQGLDLIIQSNNTLWLYLDYFTDLENYSRAFDINLVVIDGKKFENSRFSNNTYKVIKPNNITTEYINTKIQELKDKNSTNISDILDILYYINNKNI